MAIITSSSVELTVTPWCSPQWLQQQSLSVAMQTWLLDVTSMTARLRRSVGEALGYRLLLAGQGQTFSDERDYLSLEEEQAWIRQVLFSHHSGLLFSRVVIPQAAAKVNQSALQLLGARPLGEVLFIDSEDKRFDLNFAYLQSMHPYVQLAQAHVQQPIKGLWARRSICYYHQQPLAVFDMFLPPLVALVDYV